MNIKAKNAKTTFLLARYAARVLAPMVQELGHVGATLTISCTLGDNDYSDPWHVDVYVHWEKDGMALYASGLTSTRDIDETAEGFRSVVAHVLDELSKDALTVMLVDAYAHTRSVTP